MKWTGKEFFSLYNVDIEDYFNSDFDFDDEFIEHETLCGFEDEEDQVNDYFGRGESRGNYAYVWRASKEDDETLTNLPFTVYGLYITGQWNWECVGFFDNLEEAKRECEQFKNSELPSLEDELNELNKRLPNNCYAIIKREFNNGGHFYSYNVYDEQGIIYDGHFYGGDDLIEEVNQIEDAKKNFAKDHDGWNIKGIKKVKGFPSWEKSYVVSLEKNGEYLEEEFPISGIEQGRPRNVLKFIDYEFDPDYLNDQLQDLLGDDELDPEEESELE